MEDLQSLYDYVIKQINTIDSEIKHLQGKREAYNDIRLEVYSKLKKDSDN